MYSCKFPYTFIYFNRSHVSMELLKSKRKIGNVYFWLVAERVCIYISKIEERKSYQIPRHTVVLTLKLKNFFFSNRFFFFYLQKDREITRLKSKSDFLNKFAQNISRSFLLSISYVKSAFTFSAVILFSSVDVLTTRVFSSAFSLDSLSWAS